MYVAAFLEGNVMSKNCSDGNGGSNKFIDGFYSGRTSKIDVSRPKLDVRRRQELSYISDMIQQLQVMAGISGHSELFHILGEAYAEASQDRS